MRVSLLLLAVVTSQPMLAPAKRPPTLPPTCRRALEFYRDPSMLPSPHVTIEVPRTTGDRLDAAAQLGATGYALALVPDSLLTAEERDAVAMRGATARVFRAVPMYVAADTGRAYATCRGRVIRSY